MIEQATISDTTFRVALDKAMKRQNIPKKERDKRIGEYLINTSLSGRDMLIDIVEKEAADYEQSKKTPTVPSEFTEQCNFVNWFRHTCPGVILMSIRNGGYRTDTERQGQLLEGLYPGAADLFCPEYSLWIEFKKTKGYVWKPEQKQFKKDIEKIGHTYVLAIGFEDGKSKVAPIIERKLLEMNCSDVSELLSK
jgi:hypothetical protein